MNKLIKREFLQVKEGDKRKRWYVTLQCYECHKIFTVLEKGHYITTTPCEKCKIRITAYNSFISKAIKKHGTKFDYSHITKDNYINLCTPVTIICNKHGEFEQKPKDHTSSKNGKLCCPTCVYEFNKIHNKRSIESWKEELQSKTPHITMEKHGNSDSNREKCLLNCTYHGTFTAALAEIKKSKYICPMCAQDNNSWGGRFRRIDVSGTLYHIYIHELGIYKLGVTSQSVKKRFRQFEYKFDILWEQEFSTLKQAYIAEMQLFRKYKEYRNKHLYTDISGYTELLTCEIPITALQQSNLLSKGI